MVQEAGHYSRFHSYFSLESVNAGLRKWILRFLGSPFVLAGALGDGCLQRHFQRIAPSLWSSSIIVTLPALSHLIYYGNSIS